MILNLALITCITKWLAIKNLSSGFTEPLLSKTMVVDQSIKSHISIDKLIYMKFFIYQTYLKLLFFK